MIEELPYDVIEAMLDSLPVEISFIDKDDKVRYFNKNGKRIFPRPRSIIGRKVQDCHPKKSIHIVNKLLEDLKNKKRDFTEFWINLEDRKIYIRYFAVRNPNGEYLGCLEVTQDITDTQRITGEKRLLDY
jgi:PAS domain S-box-containing protein